MNNISYYVRYVYIRPEFYGFINRKFHQRWRRINHVRLSSESGSFFSCIIFFWFVVLNQNNRMKSCCIVSDDVIFWLLIMICTMVVQPREEKKITPSGICSGFVKWARNRCEIRTEPERFWWQPWVQLIFIDTPINQYFRKLKNRPLDPSVVARNILKYYVMRSYQTTCLLLTLLKEFFFGFNRFFQIFKSDTVESFGPKMF